MTARKIVIIGGVACGPKAAARARRCDAGAEITIIERGSLLSYAGCGIPYYVGGAIPEYHGLRKTQYGVLRDEQFFQTVKDIQTITRTHAVRIDRNNKKVLTKNLDTGSEEDVPYDKLVLATGALPIRPPVEGLDLDRVFFMHVPEDAAKMRELIEGDEINKAVFIGGGRIALELTESLFAHAIDSTIIEMEDSLLPAALDPEIAAVVANALREQGVEIFLNEKAVQIQSDAEGRACGVVTNEREIPADMVVVAAGVRANIELAISAGLAIGQTGAIAVNEHLQTSDPEIYAGGDCVECTNLVTRKKIYAPLGSTASRHGRVIGDNVTGGNSVFPGVVGTSVMKTMGINVSCTGLTERQAVVMGYDVSTCIVPWTDRAHYYPGGKPVLVKMIADVHNGRLLGGQIVGAGDVTKRIDVLAVALATRSTLEDVATLDLAYAPPYSTPIDSLAHAANVLLNKRDGLAKSISAPELRERMERDNDFVLLDVRELTETEKSGLKDKRVCEIPLSRLRTAKDEIPENKEIICLCQVGSRSYEACRTLEGMGFHDVKFLEGGLKFLIESSYPAIQMK